MEESSRLSVEESHIATEDSEYEQIRRKNEIAKFELLKELGILHGIERINTPGTVRPANRLHSTKRKAQIPLEPVRKSSRLAKLLVDNLQQEQMNSKEGNKKEVQHKRQFFVGPEHMTQINTDDDDDHNIDIVKPSFEDLLSYLKEEPSVLSMQESLDNFKLSLKKMTLAPNNIKKVGITKTFSLVIHPSESKLLIIAGDEFGCLGFWDVDNIDKKVEIYRPHKSPVYCLSLCAYNPVKLYATAIDGVVRSCDLEKMEFNDIYVTQPEDHTPYHTQMSPYTLLVAHGCGDVGLVDIRENKKPSRWFECHDRSVRTVQRHPLAEHEFVTSSRVGEVAIWDIRKSKKQTPMLLLSHPKGLKSAFFSPGGGMLITSCNDNKIRIYASDKNHLIMSKIHNMNTGQWLRPFQATWHPKRDDTFIIGTMDRPRQVDICGIHGRTLHSLRSPHLATVLSNCQFHATRHIIAGANNSGYIHVFRDPE